jgi:hypothetical protein
MEPIREYRGGQGETGLMFDGVDGFHLADMRMYGYSTQVKLTYCRRVLIERIWLSGVHGTASGEGYGILLGHCEDVTIRDVFSDQSSEHGRHHIYLSGACKRIRVESCRLTGGTQAQIAVYCKAAQGLAEDLEIIGNTLNGMDSDVAATGAVVATEAIRRLRIEGNTILDPRPIGVRIQSTQAAQVRGARVRDNTIVRARVAAISTDQMTGWENIDQRDNTVEAA